MPYSQLSEEPDGFRLIGPPRRVAPLAKRPVLTLMLSTAATQGERQNRKEANGYDCVQTRPGSTAMLTMHK